MMTDERLRALFHTTFDALHTPAVQPLPRRRRARRPTVLAALVLAFAFAGAVGVSAAALYGGRWFSVFGYGYTEVEPSPEGYRRFETDTFRMTDLNLPKGAVARYSDLDDPFSLPEGETSPAGLILMKDGRIYLRRIGQAEDERLDERFTQESQPFRYTNSDLEPQEGLYLGRYDFTYERLGETVSVSMYRLQDTWGRIGYAVCCEDAVLYFYDRFDSRCLTYFRALTITPDEEWVAMLDSDPNLQ